MNLIDLLREFGADDDLIALAERWINRTGENITPLTDDELTSLLSGLIALGDNDEAGVGLIGVAADTAVDLRGEQASRQEAADAEEAQIAADRARLRGEEPEATEGEGDDGGETTETETEGGDGETSTETEGGETETTTAAEDGTEIPEPVTAAAGRAGRADIRALARRIPRNAQPDVGDGTPRAELVFAANVPDIAGGARVAADRANLHRVSEAMERQYDSFRYTSGGPGGVQFHRVATLRANFPEDRRLVDSGGMFLSPSQMGRVVGAVLERSANAEAITAAGGFCAPLQPYYGVEVIGDTDRPVRDALVTFQANRGGVITMPPPILPQLTGSIGVWTESDDITAASDATKKKAIIDVVCGEPRTTTVRAITARLRYGTLLSRTYAEWTQAWADLQLVAQARRADPELLADIQSGSTVVDLVTTEVEAVRDTLNTLARAAAGMRSRHRAWEIPFRAILPEIWLVIAAESMSKTIPGGGGVQDNLVVSMQRINDWYSSRNINVTFSPDMSVIGPQAASTPLAALPPVIDWCVYPEGTWLHLDAGEEDLGTVRDTTTIAQNNFETFSETFEAAHKLGIESIWGTLNVCPSGAVMGALDPAGKCSSYT